MAKKPEANFVNRIHRKLDVGPDFHKQAMGLTSMNGTPDYYYEGCSGVLWVEYKWYPQEPLCVDLHDTKIKPHLSKLQQRWLVRASRNGVSIAVVAGYPGGCVILPDDEWKYRWDGKALENRKSTELTWVDTLNGLDLI